MMRIWSLLCVLALAPIAKSEESQAIIGQFKGQVKEREDGNLEVGFQFRGQNLTDEELARVTQVPNIVSLNLRDTQITSSGLEHLKNCPKLERLHLERTQIGNQGLSHLTNLTRLEYLNLYGTQVSDAGLKYLEPLQKLRHLYVWQTKVTEQGAENLKKVLPNLTVSLGVELDTIEVIEKKEEPEVFVDLEWLPQGGAKEPPKKSIAGSGMRIIFINQRKDPVKVFWVDYGGGLKQYGEIQAGAKKEQNSFSQAVWLITNVADKRLGYFITTDKNATATIPTE